MLPLSFLSLKCLSAFGFWGTKAHELSIEELINVSNAFRLLGSGEPSTLPLRAATCAPVSNAFRLLGSGEHDTRQ